MTDPSLETIVALETAVWEALVAGDGRADGRLLTEDFVGVYPTGIASRSDHVEQLADGPTIESYEILEPRVVVVSPTAVMLCYRAEYRRPTSSSAAPTEVMFVSSLWCEREGRWGNLFSQDTPAITA